ncbi:hypothetical protein HDU99_005581, partial [Rhizoclosmatium hyalinum]
ELAPYVEENLDPATTELTFQRYVNFQTVIALKCGISINLIPRMSILDSLMVLSYLSPSTSLAV